ncbi:hypothetical protein B0J13DRAFT_623950 [Dactylonectria estremocensis]|uniref:Dynamin N-terminal domain-containing protein n=1 Tax=Dactylonectria estremocensis TaxID=1079267 RepID=A0A9P9EQ86_9HYPO|nr:hypothetical protein B0J13DRAFT_623950 [Dactylonectria estremocensis]
MDTQVLTHNPSVLTSPDSLRKIDRLREKNIFTYLPLPQLVAIGDQSSVKSSLLESLTGIPFPRGQELCTRYATQITHRRDVHPVIDISIIPGPNALSTDKEHLGSYRKQVETISQLHAEFPEILNEVNTRMGIRTIKNPTGDKTFTEDILKIERSDISKSLRNLALDHANSVPFQKHYLGREVCADTWGILRGQKPQQALIRQACSIGHSISKRRPTDLTVEQAASVNTHPLIKRLERDFRELRQGSEKYKEARHKVRNEKQNLKRALKQQIRDEWTAEQAVDDIERQLQGIGFAKQAAVDTSCRPQRPAQKRLVEALTAPLSNTLEGQFRRRDNAINAVSAYYVVEEGPTVRRTNTSSAYPSGRAVIGEPPAESPLHVVLMSVFVKTKQERPRRCFICVGKALTLAGDDGAVQDLIHEFYTSGGLTKHLRRKHLSNLLDGDKIQCHVCDSHLTTKCTSRTMLCEYTEPCLNASLEVLATSRGHDCVPWLPLNKCIMCGLRFRF